MSNENGAHAIECSLTIDESLSTKSFLNKNQIPISIRMIQDLRDIENLQIELICQSINSHARITIIKKKHIKDATKLLSLAVDEISKSESGVYKDNKSTAIQNTLSIGNLLMS